MSTVLAGLHSEMSRSPQAVCYNEMSSPWHFFTMSTALAGLHSEMSRCPLAVHHSKISIPLLAVWTVQGICRHLSVNGPGYIWTSHCTNGPGDMRTSQWKRSREIRTSHCTNGPGDIRTSHCTNGPGDIRTSHCTNNDCISNRNGLYRVKDKECTCLNIKSYSHFVIP